MGILDSLLGKWADSAKKSFPSAFKVVSGYGLSRDWCRFRRRSHCWFSRKEDVEATAEAGYQVFIPTDRGLCPFNRWEEQKACPASELGPLVVPVADATWSWKEGGQRNRHVIQVFPAVDESPPTAIVNPQPAGETSFSELRTKGDLQELQARFRIADQDVYLVKPMYQKGHNRVNVKKIAKEARAHARSVNLGNGNSSGPMS